MEEQWEDFKEENEEKNCFSFLGTYAEGKWSYFKKMWQDKNILTSLGILLFLLVKPTKFLITDVGLPMYDVFTDCYAAGTFFGEE